MKKTELLKIYNEELSTAKVWLPLTWIISPPSRRLDHVVNSLKKDPPELNKFEICQIVTVMYSLDKNSFYIKNLIVLLINPLIQVFIRAY